MGLKLGLAWDNLMFSLPALVLALAWLGAPIFGARGSAQLGLWLAVTVAYGLFWFACAFFVNSVLTWFCCSAITEALTVGLR